MPVHQVERILDLIDVRVQGLDPKLFQQNYFEIRKYSEVLILSWIVIFVAIQENALSVLFQVGLSIPTNISF